MTFIARLQKALCIALVFPALAACGQSAKPLSVLNLGGSSAGDSLSAGPSAKKIPLRVLMLGDGPFAKKPPLRVPMVGDSLSVGPFGDLVGQYLEGRFGRPNVAVIASCGSSPESWMRAEADYVTKCGFRENTPERQEVVDFQNGKRPPGVLTLED